MIHSVNWIHLIHSTWLLLTLLRVFIVRVFYIYCYSSSRSPQSRMKTVIFTLLCNTCFCTTGFMMFSFFGVFFLYLWDVVKHIFPVFRGRVVLWCNGFIHNSTLKIVDFYILYIPIQKPPRAPWLQKQVTSQTPSCIGKILTTCN